MIHDPWLGGETVVGTWIQIHIVHKYRSWFSTGRPYTAIIFFSLRCDVINKTRSWWSTDSGPRNSAPQPIPQRFGPRNPNEPSRSNFHCVPFSGIQLVSNPRPPTFTTSSLLPALWSQVITSGEICDNVDSPFRFSHACSLVKICLSFFRWCRTIIAKLIVLGFCRYYICW